MQKNRNFAVIIAAIVTFFLVMTIMGDKVARAAELEEKREVQVGVLKKWVPYEIEEPFSIMNIERFSNFYAPYYFMKPLLQLEKEVEPQSESEQEPEPRYGIDFTRIREIFPNRPFVKEVLTDEMAEYLNKREAETGIPGAVMIAQAIWEVGWELNTPKGQGRDSKNLFNIKNCNGDYVVMIGSKWQCYDSYIESVEAYIKLITTESRYAQAYEYIKNGGDFRTYYRMLGDAGYYEASKDTYSRNCVSIIKSNALTKEGVA